MATLVAGSSGTERGYSEGSLAAVYGSLSPTDMGIGFTVYRLYTDTASANNITLYTGSGSASAVTGKSLIVDGVSYTQSGFFDFGAYVLSNYSAPDFAFVNAGTYAVSLGSGGPTYAGPTYVGVSTGAGSATAASCNFSSSGRAAGDLLFVAVMTANQAVTVAGWTEVATYSPQSRGSAGVAGGVRLTLFSKVSDGTETTVTTSDSGDIQYIAGIVVRGAGGASVAIDIGAGNNVAATTSGSFGGVTTTVDDCLVAHFVATDRDAAAASWGTPTNASLANLAERFDNGVSTGSGGGIGIWTGEKQAAGATGNTTSTQAGSAAYCWITLALKNAIGGGTDALTATNLTGGIPALGSPSISQVHAIAANAFSAGAPSLGAPSVGQVHALPAAGLTAGAPSLGAPALAEAHAFAADGIVVGIPTLGIPALGTIHVLATSSIDAGAPTLGEPSIAQAHALAANDLSSGSPVLSGPSLGQAHALTASYLAAGAPSMGSPVIAQFHALVAASLSTGAPTLDSPSLNGNIDELTAEGIDAGPPALGSASFGQRHGLTASELTSGTPVLGSSALGQRHAMTALGIVSGSPAMGSPQIGQRHAFVAVGLVTETPVVDAPALTEIHALVANDLDAGTPDFGAPSLDYVVPEVPAYRSATVPAESRSVSVAHEARAAAVPSESRSATIPAENRSATVPAEARSVSVPMAVRVAA